MFFSYFRRVIFFSFLSQTSYLIAQPLLYLGVGALQPDYYLANKPDGKLPKMHFPFHMRFNVNIKSKRPPVTWSIFNYESQALSLTPFLFLDLKKISSQDGSFKTLWSGVSLPVALPLLSGPFFELKYTLGLARTSYQLIGSDGLGGMDGLSQRPKNKIVINSYKINSGLILLSSRVLLAIDFFIYKIASSDKRSIDLLISLNYGVW